MLAELETLFKFIKVLVNKKFYGELTLHFHDGNITHQSLKQNLKPNKIDYDKLLIPEQNNLRKNNNT